MGLNFKLGCFPYAYGACPTQTTLGFYDVNVFGV